MSGIGNHNRRLRIGTASLMALGAALLPGCKKAPDTKTPIKAPTAKKSNKEPGLKQLDPKLKVKDAPIDTSPPLSLPGLAIQEASKSSNTLTKTTHKAKSDKIKALLTNFSRKIQSDKSLAKPLADLKAAIAEVKKNIEEDNLNPESIRDLSQKLSAETKDGRRALADFYDALNTSASFKETKAELLSWLGLDKNTIIKPRFSLNSGDLKIDTHYGDFGSVFDKNGALNAELKLPSGASYSLELLFNQAEDAYREKVQKIHQGSLTPLDSEDDPALVMLSKGTKINSSALIEDIQTVKTKAARILHAIYKGGQTFIVASAKPDEEISKIFDIDPDEKTDIKGLKLFVRTSPTSPLTEHDIDLIERVKDPSVIVGSKDYPKKEGVDEQQFRYFVGRKLELSVISSQRRTKNGAIEILAVDLYQKGSR